MKSTRTVLTLLALLSLEGCGDWMIHVSSGGGSSDEPTHFVAHSPQESPLPAPAIAATPLAPATVTPPATPAVLPAAAAATPAPSAPPPKPQTTSWRVESGNGQTLCSELQRWSHQTDWRVRCNTSRDFWIAESATFEGTFPDAAGQLIRSFDSPPYPEITFFQRNHVAVLSSQEETN